MREIKVDFFYKLNKGKIISNENDEIPDGHLKKINLISLTVRKDINDLFPNNENNLSKVFNFF